MLYYSFTNYIKDTLNIDISNFTDSEKLNYYYSYNYLYAKKSCELLAFQVDKVYFLNSLMKSDNDFYKDFNKNTDENCYEYPAKKRRS